MLIEWMYRKFELNNFGIIKYRFWPLLWKAIISIIFDKKLEAELLLYLKDKLIIIDDIFLEPERSPIVKFLHRHSELSIYCLSHGQNTLTNLWHDVASVNRRRKFDAQNIDVYVPSKIDASDLKRKAKNFNPVIIGNTRFDKYWVEKYPLRSKNIKLNDKFCHQIKVLFTLSKLNYGQDAAEVRELILQLTSDVNIVLCLKPHTRGMTIDELKLPNLENLIIADQYETTDLITWADLVLFTGSSIIFEAMIRKKAFVYLQGLQKYESIFDNLPQSNIYDGSIDICKVARTALTQLKCQSDSEQFLDEHVYGHTGGGVCESFVKKYVAQGPPC